MLLQQPHTDPDDSAFARPEAAGISGDPGLTKREYFAAQALAGLCVASTFSFADGGQSEAEQKMVLKEVGEISGLAVLLADAVIGRLNSLGYPTVQDQTTGETGDVPLEETSAVPQKSEAPERRAHYEPTPEQMALIPGDAVDVLLDSGVTKEFTVRSSPWQLGDGTWVVSISGRAGGFALERVTPRAKFGDSKKERTTDGG